MKEDNSETREEKLLYAKRVIQDLEAYKKSIVFPLEIDGTIKPKVVWKYDGYIQAVTYRTAELAKEALYDWDNGKTIPAILQARAVMETVAVTYLLIKKLKNNLDQENLNQIDNIIMIHSFGTRNMEDLPRVTNVLTSIDAVDKWIPGFRKIYDDLCESCHPNHMGTLWPYSKDDKEACEIHMMERNPDGQEFLDQFLPAALSSSVGILQSIMDNYSRLRDRLLSLARKKMFEMSFPQNKLNLIYRKVSSCQSTWTWQDFL